MTPLDTALAAGLAAAVAALAVVVVALMVSSRRRRRSVADAEAPAADVAAAATPKTPAPPPFPLKRAALPPSLLTGSPPPDPPPSAIAARAARTASLDVGDVVALAASLSGSLDALGGGGGAVARTVSGASTLTVASDDDAGVGAAAPAPAGPVPPPHPLGGPGPPAALDDVVLHGRLGAGASGAVFRGAWRGAPVAVKLTRVPAGDAAALDAAVREVVVGRRVAHPHVVATYAWSVVTGCGGGAWGDPVDHAAARAALARTSEAGGAVAAAAAAATVPRPPSAADSFCSDEGFGSPHAAPRAASAGGGRGGSARGAGSTPSPAGGGRGGRGPLLAALAGGRVAGGRPTAPGDAVVVAVLELCDLGTLRRALGERAAFAPTSRHGPRAAYRALLRTAQEVARGLDALHSAGVVHGDVSPSNVLLRAHRADRRGFVAKLADFGHAAPAGARVGGRVGAPAYAAPEKLAAGVGGPPSDVYALGVVLNALWCGREPYAGLHGAEVAVGVVSGGLRPAWTRPGAPPPLVALAEACWAGDPVARPTAAAVAAALADVEAAFRRQAK